MDDFIIGAEPLTGPQRFMWAIDRFAGGTHTRSGSFVRTLVLDEQYSFHSILNAYESLLAAHPVLQRRLHLSPAGPSIIPADPADVFLEVVALGEDAAERVGMARRGLRLNLRSSFQLGSTRLFRGALTRLEDGRHVIGFGLHHLIATPLSMPCLTEKFLLELMWDPHRRREPLSRSSGKSPSADSEKDFEYWVGLLSSPPVTTSLNFPTENDHGEPHIPVELEIPVAVREGMRRLGATSKTTEFMQLLTAVHVLAARFADQADVIVGTPALPMTSGAADAVTGTTSILLTRSRHGSNASFLDVLGQIRTQVLDGYGRLEVDFLAVLDRIARTSSHGGVNIPEIPITLSMLPSAPADEHVPRSQVIEGRPAQQVIRIALRPITAGHIRGEIRYNPSRISRARVAFLGQELCDLISKCVASPMQPLEQVLVQSARGADRVRESLRSAPVAPLRFSSICAFRGDVAAITQASRSISFRELDRLSARMSHGLLDLGVSPGDRVAVVVERSIEFVACCVAIMRAGCTSVPIRQTVAGELSEVELAELDAACVVASTARLGHAREIQLRTLVARASGTEWDARTVDDEEAPTLLVTSAATDAGRWTIFVDDVVRVTPASRARASFLLLPLSSYLGSLQMWSALLSGRTLVMPETDERRGVSIPASGNSDREVWLTGAGYKLFAGKLKRRLQDFGSVCVCWDLEAACDPHLGEGSSPMESHYAGLPLSSPFALRRVRRSEGSEGSVLWEPQACQVEVVGRSGSALPPGVVGRLTLQCGREGDAPACLQVSTPVWASRSGGFVSLWGAVRTVERRHGQWINADVVVQQLKGRHEVEHVTADVSVRGVSCDIAFREPVARSRSEVRAWVNSVLPPGYEVDSLIVTDGIGDARSEPRDASDIYVGELLAQVWNIPELDLESINPNLPLMSSGLSLLQLAILLGLIQADGVVTPGVDPSRLTLANLAKMARAAKLDISANPQ